jgi:hypothetical protein
MFLVLFYYPDEMLASRPAQAAVDATAVVWTAA